MNLRKIAPLLHQRLMFSKALAKSPAGGSVFWPGCSALTLNASLMSAVMKIMLKHDENVRLSTYCCMKPSLYLASNRQVAARMKFLNMYFENNNIEKIYTLCPNCTKTLPQFFKGEIISAWPILWEHMDRTQSPSCFTEKFMLHDPCATKNDTATHDSVRNILNARNINYSEFAKNGSQSTCCGRKNMLFITNPKKAAIMMDKKLEECRDYSIISYCESCVQAFRKRGKNSRHLLEIMFNTPSSRGLKNRITAAKRLGSYIKGENNA